MVKFFTAFSTALALLLAAGLPSASQVIVDQQQTTQTHFWFWPDWNGALTQSFIPSRDNVAGFATQLYMADYAVPVGSFLPGELTVELWDNFPGSGNMLLRHTETVPSGYVTMTWAAVFVVPGQKYYLRLLPPSVRPFEMYLGAGNLYPDGDLYAGDSLLNLGQRTDWDLKFQEFAVIPEPSTANLLVLLSCAARIAKHLIRTY